MSSKCVSRFHGSKNTSLQVQTPLDIPPLAPPDAQPLMDPWHPLVRDP